MRSGVIADKRCPVIQISLEAASKDKGTYRVTAARQIEQALKALEKADSLKAMHHIAEAMENCHKAGKMGTH